MIRGLLLLLWVVGSIPQVWADEALAVNVNAADAAQLASVLAGVGEKKAMAILAYRKQHGPFRSLKDLTRVKGLGPKLVERNRDRIRFDGPALLELPTKETAPKEDVSRLSLPMGAYAP